MRRPGCADQARTLAVLPAPGGRLSGGFLVNERLFASGACAVAEVTTTDELVDELGALEASDTAIVDSLFLFDSEQADALIRTARRMPVILLAHSLPSLIPGEHAQTRLVRLARERGFLPLCCGAVAPSAFMAGALNRRGLGQDRIAVIPPAPVCDGRGPAAGSTPAGSTPAGLTPEADSVRTGRRTPMILTVANWSPAKAIAHAAHALAAVADLEWSWTVIGTRDANGDCVRAVLDRITGAGLTDRVELLEPMHPDELHAYYRRAGLFLLPSLMESYGIVYAEAISHGVPVVGYRCAAVPEAVDETALLVPAGRTDLLADAIRDTIASGRALGRQTATASASSGAIPAIHGAGLPHWSTVRSRFTAAVDRMRATWSQETTAGRLPGGPHL